MPYKRKKSNRIEWVAEVMRQGKRYYKVFNSRKDALAWEAEIRSKTVVELTTPTVSLTLLDWANEYLDYAESHFVRKVFDEKRRCFKLFFKSVNPQLPAYKLDALSVLNYLKEQRKTRSGYSVNKDRKNFLAAWEWGKIYLKLPDTNPCRVDRFPVERHRRYIPPESDFRKVFEEAQGQDKVMLLGFLHSAARRGELFRLRWVDVNFANKTITLYTRKRKGGDLEHDDLPMTDELHNALLLHKQTAHEEYVFVDPMTNKPFTERRQFMRGLCKRAGVKPFGLHAIRHLSASILGDCDVPAVIIKKILRHKNLQTTERYIKPLGDARSALENLSKRYSRPNVPTTDMQSVGKLKGAMYPPLLIG